MQIIPGSQPEGPATEVLESESESPSVPPTPSAEVKTPAGSEGGTDLPSGVNAPPKREGSAPLPGGGLTQESGLPPIEVPAEDTTKPADPLEITSQPDEQPPATTKPPSVTESTEAVSSVTGSDKSGLPPLASEVGPQVGDNQPINPDNHQTAESLEGAVGGSPALPTQREVAFDRADKIISNEQGTEVSPEKPVDNGDKRGEIIGKMSRLLEDLHERVNKIGSSIDKEVREIDEEIEELQRQLTETYPKTPESLTGENK